jgi:DNA-binding NtrC family response regulator
MNLQKLIVIIDDQDFSIPALQRTLQKKGYEVKVLPVNRKLENNFFMEGLISDASKPLNIGREFLENRKVKSCATPKIVSVHSRNWEFIISEVFHKNGYGFIAHPRTDRKELS